MLEDFTKTYTYLGMSLATVWLPSKNAGGTAVDEGLDEIFKSSVSLDVNHNILHILITFVTMVRLVHPR